MAKYFDKFPQIIYDIGGTNNRNFQIVTNILFRVKFIREALSDISSYYEYLITDSETPEILAEKVYGDPEAHWIILMANDIVDAQYEWPLGYDEFQKYIVGKYTSVANAQTTYHHYEKVVLREDVQTETITEDIFLINAAQLTVNNMDVPYDTYASLPQTQEFVTVNMGNGKTVKETTYTRAVTNYDYESELNERKRSIKIIKSQYYNQVVSEFDRLTKSVERTSYIRRLT